MRNPFKYLAIAACIAAAAPAQTTTISGGNLAFQSSGTLNSTAWTLNENGYVGTYLTVPAPGTVTLTINASGVSSGGAMPRMNLAINDFKTGWDVADAPGAYSTSVALPAGTHFVRTEFANDIPSASRTLKINNIEFIGASPANANTDANARAAADTYIQNYRKGPATVSLSGPGNIPLLAGTTVNVRLARHAFNFGANIHGTSTTILSNTPYTNFFKSHFNAMVPSRAGKWNNNEATNNVVTLNTLDAMMDFAQTNNLRIRMHNLIWGNDSSAEEQPNYAVNALTNGSAGSLTALRNEISHRIDYYIADGPGGLEDQALRYDEVDIYNESWHTGVNTPGSSVNYWDRFGASGIASIYQEATDAVQSVGASTKVYVNEYNILQNSEGDDYGNYYRRHIEDIQNADGNPANGPVSGIGMQLYGLAGHSPAYMQQVLQNMSVTGLQLTLTEFGVQDQVNDDAVARQILKDSMRMMFGNPDATGFFIWGFGAGATSNLQRDSALVEADWVTLTGAGRDYEDLLGIADWDGDPTNGWNTNINLPVNPDGSIHFTGFFGDYNIAAQSGFSNLAIAKGTSAYSLQLPAPPQWSFWNTANSGSWSNAGNWTTGGVASGVGQTAYFGPLSTARAVTVDGPRTIGMFAINSSFSYTVGGSTITLDGPAGVAAIYIVNGDHTIATPIVLEDDLLVTVAPANRTLTLSGALAAGGRSITKLGDGAVQLESLQAAALTLSAGSVRFGEHVTANDPAHASDIGSVSIASAAQLDLTNNSLLVRDLPLAAVDEFREHLLAGRITSSSANASQRLGYLHELAGLTIKFTYAGDTDLDGDVDVADLGNLASAWQSSGFWVAGDFDYSGLVDVNDLGMLASNWQSGAAPLSADAAGLADAMASLGVPVSAVPEPATTVALGVLGLVARRRSRRVSHRQTTGIIPC
jgi:GH35 family endo-1,4-beta-xylanase